MGWKSKFFAFETCINLLKLISLKSVGDYTRFLFRFRLYVSSDNLRSTDRGWITSLQYVSDERARRFFDELIL